MKNVIFLLVSALLLVLFTERPARAYIDPGSGSLLLQMILGGVAAVWVAVRLYWRRVASVFRRGEGDETD